MVDREVLLARIERAERLTAALNPADRDRLLALAAELRAQLEREAPGETGDDDKISPSG
jgi:hypothetical protein